MPPRRSVATVDDSVIAAAAFPALSGSNAAVRPLSETHEAEHADDDGGAASRAAARSTMPRRRRRWRKSSARCMRPVRDRPMPARKARQAHRQADGNGGQGEAQGFPRKWRADQDCGQICPVGLQIRGEIRQEAKPAVKTAQKTIHGDRKTGVKTSR
jgi:hypothetical protein